MPIHSTLLTGLVCLIGVASAAPVCDASTFKSLTLFNIEVTSTAATVAHIVAGPDGQFTELAGNATPEETAAATQFCQVTIQYTHPGQNDVINTFIGLPLNASAWNGRFQMPGGGGWTAGNLLLIYGPVAAGYASTSTDAGHTENETAADWGLVSPGNTNWPALWDFAAVALDESATLGKLATQLYFGSPPKYSYFNGCSTGGRQGHIMAQRYPDQFDGILSGAPAIAWQTFIIGMFWPVLVANILETVPPLCVLDAFTNASISGCDELDGVKDNVIATPDKCQFNASSIVGQTVQCTKPEGIITLTEKHAQLVNAIWDGPRSVEGAFEWHGLTKGTSLRALLNTTCESVDHCVPIPFPVSTDWIAVFLARNASLDYNSLTREDFDRLFRLSVDQYASVIGTDNPDLTSFRRSGGKMIVWHGLADLVVTPLGTYDYYKRAKQFDDSLDSYYKFFAAPGVEHCGGGPGLDPSSTIFDSVVAWVENEITPETVPGRGPAVGASGTREINLCPYPKVLTYIGPDPNQASSFVCQ
ncbi:hypothetical protein JX266_000959 [Neoarthrinium moseri]|nr:hypothetical protein JX266_000959 [Neoarthrinium moseri]